jgi:hypothetical protein
MPPGAARYRLADGSISCAGSGFALTVVARARPTAHGPQHLDAAAGRAEALLARLDGLEVHAAAGSKGVRDAQ